MKLDADYKVRGTLEINGAAVGAIDQMTMDGIESMASYLGSPYTNKRAWMQFIGVGSDAVLPSTEDEHLYREIYRKLGTPSSSQDAYIVHARFNSNEPGAFYILRDVGIFNRIAGGLMAARWVTDDDHYINIGDEVDITCKIWIVSKVGE